MKSTLKEISKTVSDSEKMRDVVVVGILCNGMSMTILRAWNVQSDFYFFKETCLELDLLSLTQIISIVWCIKMSLESTYNIVVNAMKTANFFS